MEFKGIVYTFDYMLIIQIMKTKQTLKIFLFATSIFLFITCKKESSIKTEIQNSNFETTSSLELSNRLIIDPSNPNNSYDEIGSYHNLYLDLFGVNKIWENASNNSIYNENKFFCDTFLNNYNMMENYANSSLNIIVDTIMQNLTQNYSSNFAAINQFMIGNGVSSQCRSYVGSIYEVISDLTEYNNLSIRDAAQSAVEDIIAIETDILNSTSLSEEELQFLLSVASASRYSIAYSASAFTVLDNPWVDNEDIQDPDEVSSEIWVIVGADWGKIAREDVKGAVGGGVGVLMGAVSTGGAGAVVVLAAAGANSAAELLDQLLFGPAWLIWI